MKQEVINLGGEQYSVEYSVVNDKIQIESVFNLAGYFIELNDILEAEIVDRLI